MGCEPHAGLLPDVAVTPAHARPVRRPTQRKKPRGWRPVAEPVNFCGPGLLKWW